jgi:hypothetical protein
LLPVPLQQLKDAMEIGIFENLKEGKVCKQTKTFENEENTGIGGEEWSQPPAVTITALTFPRP